jgi:hypothetical protein
MNDSVYKLVSDWKADFVRLLSGAEEIYIVLNFVLGGLQNCGWLSYYPVKKILFLNTTKMGEWRNKVCDELRHIPTYSLAPCVDIDQYLNAPKVKSDKIRIGRHSRISLKYPQEPCTIYDEIMNNMSGNGYEFHFMLAHNKIKSKYQGDSRFIFHDWNQPSVPEYLANLDIYLYEINPNTRDQGPRVIVEAMAAGLPVIAENRDGMKDRIKQGITGILCNNKIGLIGGVKLLMGDKLLRDSMSNSAREYARQNFSSQNWVDALTT